MTDSSSGSGGVVVEGLTKQASPPDVQNEVITEVLNAPSDSASQALDTVISVIPTTSDIAISQLPQINVVMNASTDWFALCSTITAMLVTIIIVVITTRMTVKNFQLTIKSQEEIARNRDKLEKQKMKIETVSKNRQEWINTLRDSISKFIAQAMNYTEHWKDHEDLTNRIPANMSVQKRDQFLHKMTEETIKGSSAHKFNLNSMYVKIVLLLNINEPDSTRLITLLGDHMAKLDSSDITQEQLEESYQMIVGASQKILKAEWERVKELK